jgi:hypothetical protein
MMKVSFERVDLFLSCKDLPKLHLFNVTDGFAVVSVHDKKTNSLIKLGTTEVNENNLNPIWATKVTVDYMFEEVQELTFQVYHKTDRGSTIDLSKHELIGELKFPLSSLMCAGSQKISGALASHSRSGPQGTLEVRAEAQVNTRDLFNVTFSGDKLANKDGFFGRSDPCLEIFRLSEDGSWTAVWRCKHIENSLSPHYPTYSIPMVTLCNNDIDRPLRIAIWDFESSGKHRSMGHVETSVRALLDAHNTPFHVIEAEKVGHKGYTHSGTLMAANCNVEHHPTFTDFVMGGLEMSLVVGIDFTGSNGDPKTPASLHFIHPAGGPVNHNPYEQVIHEIGGILEVYDSDKMYSVFGFGGRVRVWLYRRHHCLP